MASAGSGGPTANPAWPSYVTTVTDKALSLEDLAHVPGLGSVPPKLVKKIAPFEGVYLGGGRFEPPPTPLAGVEPNEAAPPTRGKYL